MVDMSKPMFRYMRKCYFEKTLKAKLMKRLRVVPDVLLTPELNPVVEVFVKKDAMLNLVPS